MAKAVTPPLPPGSLYMEEVHVKAYTVTSLMKIYAFEIVAGRKVDMLPELCTYLLFIVFLAVSLWSASHSTDLQQRAYELQSVIGLDARAIDKNISFLDGYVQQAIEKGAQPYISENERSGMLNISNFRNQDQHEASSMHSLSSTSQKTVNGVSKVDATGTANSKAHDNSYNSRKPQVETSPEKQKLAASLFGGSSKTDKRGSTVGHKAGKASSHAAEKPQTTKAQVKSTAVEKIVVQPPPDLLDLGETTVVSSSPPSVDPFKQLEGLIEPTQVTSSVNHGANKSPDLMGLYVETANTDDANPLSGLTNSAIKNAHEGTTTQLSKGPNTKHSLEKDALVRQMGVTPTYSKICWAERL
ncbi:hypothetical protein EZV62_017005 [Acer yangbiense]|uniref:Uncharacterized protein n=1 Tax=Acer yangbiense TaxID=1000413 RepID=A0A5C7HSD4_9ROSI|nr:hypothetical protein EZV62_017005 [Acer yangbiense]